MKKTIAIPLAGLLVYMSAAAIAAHLVVPSGTRRWVLIGVLWLLGIIAAAVVVWFLAAAKSRRRPPTRQAQAGPDSGELDALVREAETKLSQRARRQNRQPAWDIPHRRIRFNQDQHRGALRTRAGTACRPGVPGQRDSADAFCQPVAGGPAS